MEDTTMTDPTPTRWTVEQGPILVWYGLVLTVPVWHDGEEAYDALVQCVRDADRLTKIRDLVPTATPASPENPGPNLTTAEKVAFADALLDLLTDGGTDG
jgi:hypothetical protein